MQFYSSSSGLRLFKSSRNRNASKKSNDKERRGKEKEENKKKKKRLQKKPIETDQMILISACFHFNRPVEVGAKMKNRGKGLKSGQSWRVRCGARARNSKHWGKGRVSSGFGDTAKWVEYIGMRDRRVSDEKRRG